jgi:multidrug efflux pump subunit AcrA (membrane-fusion protein)
MRPIRIVSLSALIAIALATTPVVASAQAPELNCLIEPHVVVSVGASVDGLLETVTVDRGDLVKEGQVLATLESGLERASDAVTRAQAELANKRLAELELQRAAAALDLRLLRSPINGVVMERFLSPGELVRQSPIVKLAQIHPLRVEVFVPVSVFGKVAVGMKAHVMPEAPIGGVHVARVKVVDRVIDAASGTFGVRLELPNPDHRLPAGLKCKVRFLRE